MHNNVQSNFFFQERGMAEKQTAKSMGSLGGKASADRLSSAERRERAKQAATARWSSKLPQATHGDSDHPLRIGEIEIGCYVLDDGRRVISQRALQTGIGMNMSGGAQRLLKMMGLFNAKGIPCKDLSSRISDPIKFVTQGVIAHGYEATTLADMCDVILDARKAGILSPQRMRLADQCEILVRSFAKVGIIALIDEATGYQYDRPRRDLEQLLKKFLSENLVRYARTFPNDYFKHLCRLKGVELRNDMRLPQYFGHLTNDLIYRRIAPGLLKALKERRAERGTPSNKLYWWTSEELGHPSLLLHLGTVVGLLKLNNDYDKFYAQLNTIAPVYPEVPGLFDDPADWEPQEGVAVK